jgi:hypothetical protein
MDELWHRTGFSVGSLFDRASFDLTVIRSLTGIIQILSRTRCPAKINAVPIALVGLYDLIKASTLEVQGVPLEY